MGVAGDQVLQGLLRLVLKLLATTREIATSRATWNFTLYC